MTYAEAVKKLKDKSNKSNLLFIELSYDKKIIVPYAAGVQLLSALEQARFLTGYGDELSLIQNYDQSKNIVTHLFSPLMYEQLQVAELLGLTYKEVVEMMNKEKTNNE